MNRYKIKDNIDLDILLDFGFEKIDESAYVNVDFFVGQGIDLG